MQCGLVAFVQCLQSVLQWFIARHPEYSFHWLGQFTQSLWIRYQVSGSSHRSLTLPPSPALLYQHQGHRAALEGNWAGHVQSQRPVCRKSCQWSEMKNCSLVLKNTESGRSAVLSGVIPYSFIYCIISAFPLTGTTCIALIGCLVSPAQKPVAALQRAATLWAKLHAWLMRQKERQPSIGQARRATKLSVFLWRKYYKSVII